MRISIPIIALAIAASLSTQGRAEVWDGTAYFTYYTGGNNVASVTYSYDDVAHVFSVGTPTTIAALPGADGLIFAPGGTNLIVGGQGAAVYSVNINTGTYTSAGTGGSNSYHVTLAPNGQSVYTSGPYGTSNAPLVNVPLANFGTANAPATYGVTGSDNQVTQLAFANGTTYYTNSPPNCCGNVGIYNLATNTTTELSNVRAAHGIVYDPYSGLLDLFGGGNVATLDPTTNAVSGDIHFSGAASDFDQGAPDGNGHALIAGSNGITFIDYRGGSILDPTYVTFVGGFSNIDDIAPLAGSGSITGGVPEPSTWAMMILGFIGVGVMGYRRRSNAMLAA